MLRKWGLFLFVHLQEISKLNHFQLMGIEIPQKYGGPESSECQWKAPFIPIPAFFNVVLVVEELAKVDPSVSVFVDVQNTLVAPLIMELGTEAQKQKYLSRICTDWVCFLQFSTIFKQKFRLALFVYPKCPAVPMHLP